MAGRPAFKSEDRIAVGEVRLIIMMMMIECLERELFKLKDFTLFTNHPMKVIHQPSHSDELVPEPVAGSFEPAARRWKRRQSEIRYV